MRITVPSGDDWVVRARCSGEGRKWTRWIGLSATLPEDKAMALARLHINTPRRVESGRACRIIDMEIARMHEWRARSLVEQAPEHFQREVDSWQGVSVTGVSPRKAHA